MRPAGAPAPNLIKNPAQKSLDFFKKHVQNSLNKFLKITPIINLVVCIHSQGI